MNVAQFQEWLNARGASLTVDGKGGPKTRQAIIQVFMNKSAPAISSQELDRLATRLGGTTKQLQAVSAVESGGGGFFSNGLPKILYERHYVWKRLRVRIPLLSDPTPGGYTMDANKNGMADSWEKLADMACRNPVAAFESCSWGKFQVMGAHWKALGYFSVFEFAWSMRESEAGHYEALCRYIERNGLAPAFRALSGNPQACEAFARGYNGKGFRKFSYHTKLARAMR